MRKLFSNYRMPAVLLACVISGAAYAAPPVSTADAYKTYERGRLALLAEQYDSARESFDAVLTYPGFGTLDTGLQFRTFLLSAVTASKRDDDLDAHEYMMAATQFAEATSSNWLLRARYAMHVEAWPDATLAINTVATRWPQSVAQDADDHELVRFVIFHARRDAARRADYLALANALFAARFESDFGTQPDDMWMDLILDALSRRDMTRVRELSTRLENPATLLFMRIDKRFDAVVAADPARFDLNAAVKRRSRQLSEQVAKTPRRLAAFVEYDSALFNEGRYADVLEGCDLVLARIATAPVGSPPYDDLDESLNWVWDHKSRALRALGRWPESLVALEAGRQKTEHGSENVSQSINLGAQYTDSELPQKALDSIAQIDWARSLSPYGRMQLQAVRFSAYLQLGYAAQADDALAYLREHHADAENTWQAAALEAGYIDIAAALYIERLGDTERRGAALAQAQHYRPRRTLPAVQREKERWQALLARPDVSAAIDAVGRRETVPLFYAPQ